MISATMPTMPNVKDMKDKIVNHQATNTIQRALAISLLTFFSFAATRAFSAPPDSEAKSPDVMLAAKVAAKGDPVLTALLVELERSKDQLKMDQLQTPYYIEYRVSDVEDFVTEAAFGATREDQ